jgi:superfamily I DNA/RNA helicase
MTKSLLSDAYELTHEQDAIIKKSLTGDSFIVDALAGTGKTTTLKEICLASPDKEFLYTAFNRKIVKDFSDWAVEEKIPNVRAMTGDAVGRSYVHNTKYVPYGLDVGERISSGIKYARDIVEHFKIKSLTLKEYPDPKALKEEEVKLLKPNQVVKYVKKAIEAFCISTDATILPRHFDTYEPDNMALEYANMLWEDYNDARAGVLKLEFYAMYKIFALDAPSMKRPYDVSDPKVFDTILLDEAQDTNPVAGVQYKLQKDMQIIYVGDPHQAIYGFRGAEDEMQKRSDLESLPLTISWRCPSEIAYFGNNALQKLSAKNLMKGNPNSNGEVVFGLLEDPDTIVHRTNSGCLISILYLLDIGKRPRVEPDTKKSLVSLVRSLAYFAGYANKPETIDEELEEFENLEEIKKALSKKELPYRVSILLDIIENPSRGHVGLLNSIESLSMRGYKGINIITTHKAKGLEWDSVQLASDFFGPRWDYEKQEVIMPSDPELRLIYVAGTRAKKVLGYTQKTKFILMSKEEIYQELKAKADEITRNRQEAHC